MKLTIFALALWLGAAGAGVQAAEPPKAADFVDVADAIPGIVIDLAYAGTANMFHQRFYATNRCFLRRGTVEKLRAAQREFGEAGLRLKILDGYRPLSVQQQLWKAKPDARYVAPPAQGSRHNRGAAVDVTLVDQSGREIALPTAFDDFSEKAAAHFAGLPAEALKNRGKLQQVMTKHGFAILETEWWHFDDTDWQSFPIAKVSIEELAAQQEKGSATEPGASETIKGQVDGEGPTRPTSASPANAEIGDLRKRLDALEERVRQLESPGTKQPAPR